MVDNVLSEVLKPLAGNDLKGALETLVTLKKLVATENSTSISERYQGRGFATLNMKKFHRRGTHHRDQIQEVFRRYITREIHSLFSGEPELKNAESAKQDILDAVSLMVDLPPNQQHHQDF